MSSIYRCHYLVDANLFKCSPTRPILGPQARCCEVLLILIKLLHKNYQYTLEKLSRFTAIWKVDDMNWDWGLMLHIHVLIIHVGVDRWLAGIGNCTVTIPPWCGLFSDILTEILGFQTTASLAHMSSCIVFVQ